MVVQKLRVGRNNYYVNRPLFEWLGRGADTAERG
ncbi:hypothetical protein XaFJ1_GM003100 [Xanthomonas albilineans]|nr:hypothetical protein XaFJ1_GM003100 [Xanthomonas albilineans]